jgi:signal transduction histidine kinase
MRVSFRRRVFWSLVALGTFPLAATLAVLVLEVRGIAAPGGLRASLDEVAASGRAVLSVVDTTRLSADGRQAFRDHTETIAQRTALARRAETLTRFAAGALAVTVIVASVGLIGLSLHLARRWSASFAAPIDELVRWVDLIKNHQPLPTGDRQSGGETPEFDSLRGALREMATDLEEARHRELEQERLIAFRETARAVAHEVRGPLSASRLALRQLEQAPSDRTAGALTVIGEEIDRLERMAREFSEFGRLPEGPEAEIDIDELLTSVISATVPDHVPVSHQVDSGVVVQGHYEPLRRALQNLVHNAIEASGDSGIEITAERKRGNGRAMVRLHITDHGPGIPAEQRHRIFEPYFTTKHQGTGLGLALVKQTVLAHQGTIAVHDTPGGGATFIIDIPLSP